jgi:hypothetical protein
MNKQFILLLNLISVPLIAQHRLIVFVRSYPSIGQAVPVSKVMTMRNTEKAATQVLEANISSVPVPGVYATYAGFLTASTPFGGEIRFPRKQQAVALDIIVTPRVEPILMAGRTVHHWQWAKNPKTGQHLPLIAYRIERIKDKETGIYYWQTTRVPAPKNGVIPLRSMVIFADPHAIYIPVGAKLSDNNPQLILPDIYTTKKLNPEVSAMSVLNIKQFFRLVKPASKKGSEQSWIWQLAE